MKIIMTILGIIVLIFFYPLFLFPFIFLLDSPHAGFGNHFLFYLGAIAPVIFLGWIVYYNSRDAVLAVISIIIPALILSYQFSIGPKLDNPKRKDFKTLERDYVCDNKAFIHVEKNGYTWNSLVLVQHNKLLKYNKTNIGKIMNEANKLRFVSDSEWDEDDNAIELAEKFIPVCKDTNGKTLLDNYETISSEKRREL